MLRLYISLFLISFIVACSTNSASSTYEDSEDDFEESSSSIAKDVSSNSQEACSADSCKIEIPKLNAKNLFVTHYTDCEGVHALNYALEWIPGIRHANWVAFRWDAYTSQENTSRGSDWAWDPQIPTTKGEVTESNHKSDGFDKGHLVASADRLYCEEANSQTFYYSNISPQISSFNAGFWESLEEKVRAWGRSTLAGEFDTVYVVKGGSINDLLTDFEGEVKANDGKFPVADSQGQTIKGLIVPAHYYMAVLTIKNGVYNAIAFWVPHSEKLPQNPSAEELSNYAMSIDSLENLTQIDFFHNLPDSIEAKVESALNLNDWK